nr:hypothetical protein [Acinetobacter nosocomialis]
MDQVPVHLAQWYLQLPPAEPGSTVTVSFPDGTTATVVAGPDGKWTVPNPGDLTFTLYL